MGESGAEPLDRWPATHEVLLGSNTRNILVLVGPMSLHVHLSPSPTVFRCQRKPAPVASIRGVGEPPWWTSYE